MDVRTNSEYLDFLAKRLDEFSKTFEDFMTHHVENSGFGDMALGIAPAVLPKDSADKARVRVLTDELNRLSGGLMDLSSVTDVRIAVQGAGVLDPFVNWQRMLEPKPLLDAPVVRGCCLQAAGRLEGLKAKAEALSSPTIEPSLLHPLVVGRGPTSLERWPSPASSCGRRGSRRRSNEAAHRSEQRE